MDSDCMYVSNRILPLYMQGNDLKALEANKSAMNRGSSQLSAWGLGEPGLDSNSVQWPAEHRK